MILRPRLNRNGFFLSYFEYKTFLDMFLRDIVFKRTDIKKPREDHYSRYHCPRRVLILLISQGLEAETYAIDMI